MGSDACWYVDKDDASRRLMYRIFWTPDTPWNWMRDGDLKALRSRVARANGIDCFASLNVFLHYEELPSFYDLGFDFDSADLAASAADAVVLSRRLSELSIPFRTYFSGSKGIHIVIPHQVAGIPARPDGGAVTKLWQRSLKDELNLATLDTEIHGAKRMWRCSNTINSKTGLFKVPITTEELDRPDRLRDLAATPRALQVDIPLKVHDVLHAELWPFTLKADAAIRDRAQYRAARSDVQLNSIPVCVSGVLNDPAKVVRQATTWGKRVPSRNDLTFIAATFFANHASLDETEAHELLGRAWQEKVAAISSSDPKQIERSTFTAIQAVYRGGYEFSCGNAISKGCKCSALCPLFRKQNEQELAEGQATKTGDGTDGVS